MPTNNPSDIHKGHRQRMREKLLLSEKCNLPEHELLEMLLYYSIPRRNTNDLAHLLLRKYGSIKEIVNAPIEELMAFQQIGTSSAVLLRLLGEIFSKYTSDLSHRQKLDSVDKIEEYLKWKFCKETEECVYLLMLDKSFSLIDCKKISTGGAREVVANKKACFNAAFDAKACYVVLAHNHLSGIAAPSSEDRAASLNLQLGFNLLGIDLIEHFIFCGDKFVQILNNGNIF